MEKKQLNCKLTEIKSVDDSEDYFIFEGYASTFGNVDRGDDIIVRGAFTETISELEKNATPILGTKYKKMMPALWQHDWAQPIGSFIEMAEDEKGLFVKALLPKDDDFVKGRVIPQMKAGSISDMSIGFMIVEHSYEKSIRKLEKVELYETSLVTIPMNPKAKVTNFKSVTPFQDLPLADRGREWDSDAAINRVRGFTDSVDDASPEYKRAFLWYNSDDQEAFGSYKLPIADVIDGRLYAIPRAIFAAAAALRGARGGVDLPSEDEPRVIAHINRYYDKMGLESPFKETSSFRVDDELSLDERTFESLLTSGVCFSKKNAKKIISLLKDDIRRDASVKSQRDAELKEKLEKLLNTL